VSTTAEPITTLFPSTEPTAEPTTEVTTEPELTTVQTTPYPTTAEPTTEPTTTPTTKPTTTGSTSTTWVPSRRRRRSNAKQPADDKQFDIDDIQFVELDPKV